MRAPNTSETHDLRQAQLLKLVAHSFCKELARYGADRGDIITVSSLILDYVVSNQAPNETFVRAPDIDLRVVAHRWRGAGELAHHEVSLRPLSDRDLPRVAEWLAKTDVQSTFAVRFPQDEQTLADHLLAARPPTYFAIFADDRPIGLIGADDADASSGKVEMKKFIGDTNYRGRGIGKRATFLWLYYAFDVLNVNKVYIHTLDTNIRNINLNAQLGFELEGILFQDIFLDGAHRDVLRMSLLKERWAKLFGSAC